MKSTYELSTNLFYLGKNTYFNIKEVWVGNNNHKNFLSKREYQLLMLFISNEGRLISKEEILKNIWGGHASPAVVGVLVQRLRNKMGEASCLIEGRKQGGYLYKKSE